MTDNLFQDNMNDQDHIDPNKNYLEELVGEGKKFKTVEDLAMGKAESDRYIKFKEQEMDRLRYDYLQLRKDLETRAQLEDLLKNTNQQQSSSDDTQNANDAIINKPTVDEKEIESLLDRKIREHELTRKQQENANLVRTKLKERYGNNYTNVLQEYAESMGLTQEFVNDMARNHPNLLFKSLGVEEQRTEQFQSPPNSSRRSDSFAPKGKNARTWTYYEDLRKSSPSVYLDPKTQSQMYKDAIELGDAFKDGAYESFA